MAKRINVFLAAPFTTYVRSQSFGAGGAMNYVCVALNDLRYHGYDVFCAHEREDWGQSLYSPEDALQLDLQGLKESNVVVAFLGDPPSPGVQMELGAALVWRKPIVILAQESAEIPYLVNGISSIVSTHLIRYKTIDTVVDHIRDGIDIVLDSKYEF